MLAYASYLDFKSREIDLRVWFKLAVPIAVVSMLELATTEQGASVNEGIERILLGTAIVCALSGALFLAGMLGGGDIVPLAVIGITHPWNPLAGILGIEQTMLPPVLLVLAYASFAAASQSIMLLAYNLTFNRNEIGRLPGRKLKLVYALTAIPARSADLVKKRFWFPLERSWDNEQRYRLYFKVEEDDSVLRAKVKQMIAARVVSENQRVWATYGIPFVAFIFVGYLATLFLGDSLVLSILRFLTGGGH
uniref:A24 family peptidase n=1 Tax=Fervidicoccus fontis TaxID=683846 RepID=A0A7J3ZKQ8_9CREN